LTRAHKIARYQHYRKRLILAWFLNVIGRGQGTSDVVIVKKKWNCGSTKALKFLPWLRHYSCLKKS